MEGRKLSALGAEAKRKMGRETAEFILSILKAYPYGLTTYELSHELGKAKEPGKRIIEAGTVRSALDRLDREKKIETKETLKEGRLTKVIYPKGVLEVERPTGYFEFDKDRLSGWQFKDQLFVYAKDRNTIVVSENPLHIQGKPRETVHPKYADGKMSFRVSMDLIEFYDLSNNHAEPLVEGTTIVIRIKPRVSGEMENEIMKWMLRNKTFLIVDDNPDVLNSVRGDIVRKFKNLFPEVPEKEAEYRMNNRIFQAASPAAARKIIKKKNPSVLIVDWVFSEKPVGTDVLKFAKKFRPMASIIITAVPHGRTEIQNFIDSGAIWCYNKDVARLTDKILVKASKKGAANL